MLTVGLELFTALPIKRLTTLLLPRLLVNSPGKSRIKFLIASNKATSLKV